MVTRGDHFYCTDPEGELAPSSGYEREGETGHVFKTAQPGTIPIYRFYHPTTRDHFYTRDPNGEIGPPAYRPEGIEWYMYPTRSHEGLVALYRWYHPTIGDHFYTTDPTGELAPSSGYRYEGILGYLYPFSTPSSTPLYRWYLSGLMTKFEFSPSITEDQKKKLYERHSFAYYRAGLTTHLTPAEKSSVRALYWGRIDHDVNNDPGVNGSAFLGGRQLFINFNVLFPQGNNEIAQTLLHEMMHCAGYNHPSKSGTPGDNGPYFGSAPLRAELAIAGVQSDVVTLAAAAVEDEVGVVREVCGVVDVDADKRIAAAAASTADGEEGV